MENEIEFWVLSTASDLAARDLAGLTVRTDTATNGAFVSEGVNVVTLQSAEIAEALGTGVIDAAASTSPTPLFDIARDDATLTLYRFTGTDSGLNDRTMISSGQSDVFGTEGNELQPSFSAGPSTDNENWFLLGGDDSIQAGTGDDQIFGGPGTDTSVTAVDRATLTLQVFDGFETLTDRTGFYGTDTLFDVEKLSFGSGTEAPQFDLTVFAGLAGLSGPDLTQFIELYIAYFNRAPDAIGLGFWGTSFANGVTLRESAALFIDQNEFRGDYPEGTTNEAFVSTVYQNVLGRAFDQEGRDFWVGVLNDGSVSRDQFILEVLFGAKAAPPVGASQEFIDQQLIDQAYLATKTDLGTYFAIELGISQDASDAMALYDGSPESVTAALDFMDAQYAAASDPVTGQFLLQVRGVLDNPFPDRPGADGTQTPTPPDGPQLPSLDAIDDSFTVQEDVATELNVLTNDTGSGLSLDSFTTASNGTLELIPVFGGRLLYTPNADFIGEDTFTYTTVDGFNQRDTATVTVTVEEDDVGGTPATALPITLGERVTSEVEPRDSDGFDADFFRIDLSGSNVAAYNVVLDGEAVGGLEFFIRPEDGNAIALGGSDNQLLIIRDANQTELIVGVQTTPGVPFTSDADTYTLEVFEIFQSDDLPADTSTQMYVNLAGDGIWSTSDSAASELAIIDTSGDVDWIGLFGLRNSSYEITATSTEIDPDLFLRDAAGNSLVGGFSTGDQETLVFDVPETGMYFIDVRAFGEINPTGVYDLTVTEII